MRKNYNVKYQGLTDRRRFGVELEINNTVPRGLIRDVINDYSDRKIKIASWAQSRNNNYWHVKQDATCGIIGRGFDKGWEVASFVGRGKEDIEHIGMVAQALSEAGCEVNDNCGLHVHVEVTDFDAYQIGILLGHYAKFEWALLQSLPDCRQFNPYCEPLYTEFNTSERRKYWSAPEMWFRMRPFDLSPHDNPCRWRSVNLVNYAHSLVNKNWNRKTVEFRLPECSLIDYDVKNWIRFFVNFVDWVKDQDMPVDIDGVSFRNAFMHMGLGHEEDKFYILGKELFSTKTWLLRRFIRFNVTSQFWVTAAKEMLNEMWHPVRNFT